MIFRFTRVTMVILAATLSLPLVADEPELANTQQASPGEYSDEVFARQGNVVMTHRELDAEFSKIPAKFRLAYIRDGDRVSELIQNLLRGKLVAADARAAKYNELPLVETRMKTAAEVELAEAWALQIVEDAPDADYETLAREHYLAYPEEYQTENIVDVSHILINSENRSDEEALQLALSLTQRLAEDPGQFEAIVMEYSDDPSKASNNGRFPMMKKDDMVKNFEIAAFALENRGDISEPVETPYGYHIIVLNNKFPPRLKDYEDVKEEAMVKARERYLTAYRSRYLTKLLSPPITFSEGALDAMARRHFGENLELVPHYQE